MVQFFFMHTVHDDSDLQLQTYQTKDILVGLLLLLLLLLLVVLDLLLLLVGLVLDFGATSSGTVQQ